MTPANSIPMRATILERRTIHGLQSGSAIERVGDFYFVAGDDSADLFRVDRVWNIVGRTRLFETEVTDGQRITKAIKPDLEGMTVVEWSGRRELLLFGSGSKSPARDVCFRVDVTEPTKPNNVRRVDLKPLYDTFRSNKRIVGTQKLNLEAASSTDKALFLFQRGNISGINAFIEYRLDEFLAFLDDPVNIPQSHVRALTLPSLQNRVAGFSAAFNLANSNQILFAASVEDTPDEIQDGPTLGSFVGLLDLNVPEAANPVWCIPVQMESSLAPVKIEGLTLESFNGNSYEILAVTDNDEGDSEFLRIEIA